MSLAVAVIAVKATILLGLALLFRVHGSNGWLFTLSLAQAGEFGFVLLTYSVQNNVIPVETSQILSLVVALFFSEVGDQWGGRRRSACATSISSSCRSTR